MQVKQPKKQVGFPMGLRVGGMFTELGRVWGRTNEEVLHKLIQDVNVSVEIQDKFAQFLMDNPSKEKNTTTRTFNIVVSAEDTEMINGMLKDLKYRNIARKSDLIRKLVEFFHLNEIAAASGK